MENDDKAGDYTCGEGEGVYREYLYFPLNFAVNLKMLLKIVLKKNHALYDSTYRKIKIKQN